jgi:hypothetical protein
LKGQALQSDAGRVKIANVDLENDMKGLNPKNPAQVKDFFQKQLKKHFSEYNTVQQGNILTYMTAIYQAGVDNKNTSENDIAAGLKTIQGNPFGTVTDPAKRKVLVDYFFGMYNNAKESAKDSAKDSANPQATNPQATADNNKKSVPNLLQQNQVRSALINAGFKKKDANDAVNQILTSNPELKNDLDGFLKAAFNLFQK